MEVGECYGPIHWRRSFGNTGAVQTNKNKKSLTGGDAVWLSQKLVLILMSYRKRIYYGLLFLLHKLKYAAME